MANDIFYAISGINIKNGSAVVTTTFTGKYKTLDTYVSNNPNLTTIENKYDNKFDDIIYYNVAVKGTPVSGCC